MHVYSRDVFPFCSSAYPLAAFSSSKIETWGIICALEFVCPLKRLASFTVAAFLVVSPDRIVLKL